MKKFSHNSYYPFIIIGLVCGALHYFATSYFNINKSFAFFGAIVLALVIYSLIVERKKPE